MGMVMYLRRATPADIERFGHDPAAAEDFVFPVDYDESDDGLIEFDKAWQALHFMLTGEAYGLGQPLGIIADETPFVRTGDIGSFEFSVVSPDRMAVFAASLANLDDAALAARYDPEAMAAADVYMADVFLEEGPEALEYIMQGVPALRKLASVCAAAGDGAIRVLA